MDLAMKSSALTQCTWELENRY